jgi:HD superfamily phosphodiesterase
MQEFNFAWDLLSNFVKEICQGRDPSHGYEHMHNVAKTTLTIFLELHQSVEHNLYFAKDCIIVAWLHDVADHKYDHDGKLRQKVIHFLQQNFEHHDFLMNIIDRISFSKEDQALKRNIKPDWMKVIGQYGCLIRDIVSDADKLEALGQIGFERCVQFTKHKYLEEHHKEIHHVLLKERVLAHAQEKLLRLKDEFIHTSSGKKLAEPLHQDLVIALGKL